MEISNEVELTKYKGLSGWLIIIIFEFILFGILSLRDFFNLIAWLGGQDATLYGISQNYKLNLFSIFTKIEVVAALMIFVFSSYLVVLFFGKKKIFSKVSVYFLVALIFFRLITNIFTYYLFGSLWFELYIITAVVFILNTISIAYIINSRRVRATFIN